MKPQGTWEWLEYIGGAFCLLMIVYKMTAECIGYRMPIDIFDVFAGMWATRAWAKYVWERGGRWQKL